MLEHRVHTTQAVCDGIFLFACTVCICVLAEQRSSHITLSTACKQLPTCKTPGHVSKLVGSLTYQLPSSHALTLGAMLCAGALPEPQASRTAMPALIVNM